MRNFGELATFFFMVFAISGCSSMTGPALKHETGESLGQGRYRFSARLETSRLYSLPTSGATSSGVSQPNKVFQGSVLGIQGSYGVAPPMDISLATFFSIAGGGWRISTKYQILTGGPFAVAVMLGYGAYSGSGTSLYSAATNSVEVTQTLSAKIGELSFPASMRLGTNFLAYSGLHFYRAGVSGSIDGIGVSDAATDLGTNLGIRYFWSAQVYSDVEFAYVSIHDPFEGGKRFVPFFGLGLGVSF